MREAWKPHSIYDGMKPRNMPVSKVFYRADDGYAPSNTGWKPGIHMPRWASRLTLEITEVRVERLQDISEADAKAEGLQWVAPTFGVPGLASTWHGNPRLSYFALWSEINGEGSIDANPWVWAVTFKVHNHNVDEVRRCLGAGV